MKKLLQTLILLASLAILFTVWYKTCDFEKAPPRETEETEKIVIATIQDEYGDETDPFRKAIDITQPPTSQSNEQTMAVGIPEDAIKVTVIWVSDGDTYGVDLNGTETTIRLIGVDTPESVAPEEYLEKSGKENTEEGKIASNVMKEKLPAGTEIYIVIGEQPTDDYGRTLAYAWFSDGQMIEEFLLVNGYARTLPIEPNTQYAEHFAELEQLAETAA